MDISFSEYYDIIHRIEELERNSLSENVFFVPLCVIALVFVVLGCMALAIFIDSRKKR